MKRDPYTQKQLFALSLTAPILVTGSKPRYDALRTDTPEQSAKLLSSWWGIEDEDELQRTIHWLEHEGGHTILFQRWRNYLERMSYQDRKAHIAALKESDRDDYIRAQVVERYRLDLGGYSILAFDLCRITLLIRAGYDIGWVNEDQAWEVLLRQADRIIDNQMWWTHFDYLYSFLVGRAFGMRYEIEGNLKSIREAHTLLTDPNSPWLSYAPWPNFQAEETAAASTTLH